MANEIHNPVKTKKFPATTSDKTINDFLEDKEFVGAVALPVGGIVPANQKKDAKQIEQQLVGTYSSSGASVNDPHAAVQCSYLQIFYREIPYVLEKQAEEEQEEQQE